MLTAEQVVRAARDYHPDFSTHVVPAPMALRQLQRIAKQLAERLLIANAHSIVSATTFNAAAVADAATTGNGFELPPHLRVLQAAVNYGDCARELTLIPFAHRLDAVRRWPSAYLLGGKLFPVLRRHAEGEPHGWEDVVEVKVHLIPEQPELVAPSDELLLPTRAEPVLAAQLALWMASRVNGALSELPGLQAEAARAEEALLTGVSTMDSNESWYVR